MNGRCFCAPSGGRCGCSWRPRASRYWDTKFLVQSLKRNTNVELTAVYRLNASRYVAVVSATGAETRTDQDLFPRTADAMNAFDVIVLGREAETLH